MVEGPVERVPVTVIGSYISPYVRKVLVCLSLKGIDYRIDPIIPYFGDETFSRVSPLRRIPVLIDDVVTWAPQIRGGAYYRRESGAAGEGPGSR